MIQSSVLQVVLQLDPGGTERLVLEIVRRLHAGMPMAVCCLDAAGAWAENVTALGVPLHVLQRTAGFHPRLAWQLAGVVRATGADVLHCHHYTPFVYGRLASLLSPGTRVIYTEHGRLSDSPPSAKRRLANRLLMTGANDLFSVSHDLRKHLLLEGVPDRMRVIWNGIDPGDAPTAAQRDAARSAIGAEPHDVVVGAVARLDPVKDLALLVEAVARAAATRPALRLVIIGEGPERDNIEAAIERHRSAVRVSLLGHRDDARALLPGLDVFANSSTSEGISLTILEAMAAELPVVATDVGGTGEVVLDHETGRLSPARNPAAFADALVDVAVDAARARVFGQAGRRRLLEHFTIDEMLRQYERVYRTPPRRRS